MQELRGCSDNCPPLIVFWGGPRGLLQVGWGADSRAPGQGVFSCPGLTWIQVGVAQSGWGGAAPRGARREGQGVLAGVQGGAEVRAWPPGGAAPLWAVGYS